VALALVALLTVGGCAGGDHAGVPKAQARERADATAKSYSASVRAFGAQLEFRRTEPATARDGELWVATYLLLPPMPPDESVVFCVYVSDDDTWAHRTLEDSCVRDDGTLPGTQGG
jgi:hypothetical protein